MLIRKALMQLSNFEIIGHDRLSTAGTLRVAGGRVFGRIVTEKGKEFLLDKHQKLKPEEDILIFQHRENKDKERPFALRLLIDGEIFRAKQIARKKENEQVLQGDQLPTVRFG